jgi:hypothetical protein
LRSGCREQRARLLIVVGGPFAPPVTARSSWRYDGGFTYQALSAELT